MSAVETVRFQGVTFRRYPQAREWSDRVYFTPGIADRRRGVNYLHIEVWKSAHGPVPEGHEIHHVDFDPSNNDLENLVCLTVAEHDAVHSAARRARASTPERIQHLADVRPLASAWHRSPEGIAWHVRHAARFNFGRGEPRTEVCDQCGTDYVTTSPSRHDRFCSNKCKSAWRRASGVDDEQRSCPQCDREYSINRYSKAKYCSRLCANRHRAGHPPASVQSGR